MAVGVEDVDKAIAGTRHVVMLCRVLLRIGDKQTAVDVLDAKRCVVGGDIRILETTVGGYWNVVPIGASSGSGAEHVNCSGAEVSRKKEDALCIHAKHEALVNGIRRVVDRENGLIRRGQPAGPSRNGSVLGVPDKRRQKIRPRDENTRGAASLVPHKAGRRCRRRVRRIVWVGMLAGSAGHVAPG